MQPFYRTAKENSIHLLTSLVIKVVIAWTKIGRVSNRLVVLAASASRATRGGVSNKIEARGQAAIIGLAGCNTGCLISVEIRVVVKGIRAGKTTGVTDLGLNEDRRHGRLDVLCSRVAGILGPGHINLAGDLDCLCDGYDYLASLGSGSVDWSSNALLSRGVNSCGCGCDDA